MASAEMAHPNQKTAQVLVSVHIKVRKGSVHVFNITTPCHTPESANLDITSNSLPFAKAIGIEALLAKGRVWQTIQKIHRSMLRRVP